MSYTKVIEDNGEFEVWIAMAGDVPPPEGFSFVIGIGRTRDAAIADAIADLQNTIEALKDEAKE